jgi:hypothetical protein
MHMARFHRLLVVSLAVLLALIAVAPAFADPINSSHAYIYNNVFTCDNGQTARLVTPSDPTPVIQVIGTNQVFVGTGGRNVGMVDGVTIYDETWTLASSNGQARGLADSLLSCSAHYQFEDEELGLVTGTFTITGFLTPRKS